MTFDDLQEQSKAMNEKSDCTVKACVVLCGVSYADAHAAMKKLGRRNRSRSPNWESHQTAIKGFGFELIEEKFPGKTVVTLERDLKRYGGGRKYLIEVRGHVLAFDGKQIVDWSAGRRHRVRAVHQVKAVVSDEKPIEQTQGDLKMVDHTQGEVLNRNADPIDRGLVPNWLRGMPRPKGAPKKGVRVVQTIDNNESHEGEVVDYLSSQFIIRFDTGRERIVAVGDDWAVK